LKTYTLLVWIVGLLSVLWAAADGPGARSLDSAELAAAVAPAVQGAKQERLAAAEREDDEAAGGWHKSLDNPVLGGNLGTCFDVSLLREGPTYRTRYSFITLSPVPK
jgi:hypothetical protein